MTFIPHNSVILHSRVLLWGNLNVIQGAFKCDFITTRWNLVPKIALSLPSNFSPLENSGKDHGNTPGEEVLCAAVGFQLHPNPPVHLWQPLVDSLLGDGCFGDELNQERNKARGHFPIQ